jgi:hypothetical protein
MKPDQFAYISKDLNFSIRIDFNKLDTETIKDILYNIGDSSRITIRIPYSIEYDTIKELLNIKDLTNEEKNRITLDFIAE